MQYTKDKIKKALALIFGNCDYKAWIYNKNPHVLNSSVYQVVTVDYIFKNDGKTIVVLVAVSE